MIRFLSDYGPQQGPNSRQALVTIQQIMIPHELKEPHPTGTEQPTGIGDIGLPVSGQILLNPQQGPNSRQALVTPVPPFQFCRDGSPTGTEQPTGIGDFPHSCKPSNSVLSPTGTEQPTGIGDPKFLTCFSTCSIPNRDRTADRHW